MIKNLLIFLSCFFVFSMNANALLKEETSKTEGGFLCMYKSSSGDYKISTRYYYNYVTWTNLEQVKLTKEDSKLFYYDYNEFSENSSFTDYTANSINFYANYDAISDVDLRYEYYTKADMNWKLNDPDVVYNKPEELCPIKMVAYKVNTESDGEQYQFLACNGDSCDDLACEYDGANKQNCKTLKQKAEELTSDVSSIIELNYNTGVVTENNFYDPDNSNIQEEYNKTQEEKEKYCNVDSDDYDEEKCKEITEMENFTVDTAENQGISEAELKHEYLSFKANINMNFDINKGCESYLGNPKDNIKKPPAYYLQFAFNLIKYIAIIMLLALTVAEFTKALASSNQDAIKKALTNTIKRLIIAVVIFLLPILIEFLFKVLGIYSSTTCGIE